MINPLTQHQVPRQTIKMLFEVWTASTLYSIYGIAQYFVDKKRLLKNLPAADGTFLEEHLPHVEKLVTISTMEKTWEAPTYLNIGAGIGFALPLGGGFDDKSKRLAAFVKPRQNSTDPLTPTSYEILDLDKEGKEFWINDPDSLKNFLQSYSIPQNSIPAVLPVKIWEHSVDPGLKLWKHRETRVMGTNKQAVVKKVVKYKHLIDPRFRAVAGLSVITTVVILAEWDVRKKTLAAFMRDIVG